MLTINKTEHSYYFDSRESETFTTWKDFKDFRNNDLGAWNEIMLVRYDFEDWGLELHFVSQRKGYTWTASIEKVEEKDIPEINEFLKNAWTFLQELWCEISLDKDNTISRNTHNHR